MDPEFGKERRGVRLTVCPQSPERLGRAKLMSFFYPNHDYHRKNERVHEHKKIQRLRLIGVARIFAGGRVHSIVALNADDLFL